MPAQFVERAQQVVLVGQPPLVFRDDGYPIAIPIDPERIAPLAAATDVDGAGWNARLMLVENPAHFLLPPNLLVATDWPPGAVEHRLSREAFSAAAGTACPLTADVPRPDRTRRNVDREASTGAGF
jgi:hypothetical protein